MEQIIEEKIVQYLIDEGFTDAQIEKQYERLLKGLKDKVLHIRLSLYEFILIKDSPAKMIRHAIRSMYGKKEG